MSATFRVAGPGDIAALHPLIERAFRGETAKRDWTHEADLLGGQRTDPATLAAMIADPAQRILLAERDREAIACVQLTDKGAGIAYLGMLTVDPDRQAEGLGRTILAEAEAFASATLAAYTIELTAIRQRTILIAWYERRGYARTGEMRPFPYENLQIGIPTTRDLEFVVLAKSLAPAPPAPIS